MMRSLIYRMLDQLTDWLVDCMIMIEPKQPRRQTLDYHVTKLPDEILAIVRVTWYEDGKPKEIDEQVIMEDDKDGYAAFAELVGHSMQNGANVSIRSAYNPEDLGILE
jgi:hypothetical protein